MEDSSESLSIYFEILVFLGFISVNICDINMF